jgi:GNAT superfamily N-acetyltransferase
MTDQAVSTHAARAVDVDEIISVSTRVQESLTAAGSLQQIGPLSRTTVSSAVEARRCYVAIDESGQTIGCVMIRTIDEEYFAPCPDFNVTDYPKPWWYLHSMMLLPEYQGKGHGLKFFDDVIEALGTTAGTVLLDCWAGNKKLRSFYTRVGCQYIATLPEEDYEIAVFVRLLEERSGTFLRIS